MLSLHSASRLYTDYELLDKFSRYVYVNGYVDERLNDAIDLMSKVTGYDPDFIRGFMGKTLQDILKVPEDKL